jgi:hypothetical protein
MAVVEILVVFFAWVVGVFLHPLVPVTFSDPPEYQVLFRHQYNAV